DVAVGTHHAMAWDEVRDGIVGQRGPDSADGGWPPGLASHPPIGPHLTARNLTRFVQDSLLERGQSTQVESHALLAVQLVLDLLGEVWRRDRGRQRPAHLLP